MQSLLHVGLNMPGPIWCFPVSSRQKCHQENDSLSIPEYEAGGNGCQVNTNATSNRMSLEQWQAWIEKDNEVQTDINVSQKKAEMRGKQHTYGCIKRDMTVTEMT